MHSKTIKYLELDKVLQFFILEATSEEGKAFFSFLRPYSSLEKVLNAQKTLKEFCYLIEKFPFKLSFFPSLKPLFKNLSQELYIFDFEDLWGLEAFLRAQDKVFGWLEYIFNKENTKLDELKSEMVCPKRLKQAIFRCVGENGALKDESSPRLLEIRNDIRAIQNKCRKKIEDFFKDKKISHYLQDEFFTLSSDRYVVPLKANFKGKLEGIVHDYSHTGETCYVEPYFLVELNNKLQLLKLQEKEEELSILKYLTQLARQEQDSLFHCYNFVVKIDVLLTKAKIAKKIGANILMVNKDGCLSLKQARHPLLVLRNQNVVPVDIELKSGQKGLVITGGNAGGKTVCLKTLGLTALMVLCGLPVCCAENSEIPYFEQIFALMGDEQSLEESLSTFTAQIESLKEYLPCSSPTTLFILDEFGSGTDPSQGAALAQAVVEYILDNDGWIACATHFPGLKLYALTNDKLRVCSVLFDPNTKRPLYKLTYDQVGASFALQVARDRGLDESIIKRAQAILGSEVDKQDNLLERLNRLVWQKEEELLKFKHKREKIIKKLKHVLEKIRNRNKNLEEEIQKAKQHILNEWKKNKLSRKKALERLNDLKKRIVTPAPVKEEIFIPSVGEKCLYLPWQREAKVVSVDIKKKQLKLDLGGVSVWCVFSDVAPLNQAKECKQSGVITKIEECLPLKLDLRGLRVEEALIEVDKFLNLATLKCVNKIEILHGKGSGSLRRAIHEFLKDHSLVSKYYLAPLEQGGDGVTIVELN
ncbi:endonuclease MutS2 [Desulfonauticus submarinus]